VKIIRQAVEQMTEGPVKLKQHPVTIKVPAGEVFASAEAARGQCSFYIRSDGTDKPYRVKICSPSFRNLIAMPYLIRDVRIADIPIIYWSLNYWPVECDR
ncbi:MAG: NADH-quinone oxidoreductase subunit D, partial [Nitrososphaerota archaeon]